MNEPTERDGAPSIPAIPVTRIGGWRHQREAFWRALGKKAFMLAMDMGCVTGDAEVIINRGGASKRVTLAYLHNKLGGGLTGDRTTIGWDLNIPTMIRCVRADGSVGLAPIRATKFTGKMPTVRVYLGSGDQIRCTPDHEIVTPRGKVYAADLRKGDEVLIAPVDANLPAKYLGTAPLRAYVMRVAKSAPADVYDVSVADDAHTYIANGIVVGNTGKTKVAIDLLQNSGAKRVLVVCPKSVVNVWPGELARHLAVPRSMRVLALDGGSVAKRAGLLKEALKLASPLVVVVNYEAVWRAEFAAAVMQIDWDYVIADESHRIKSPGGSASKFMTRLATRAQHRLALTGTPMPHSPLDIFAQYRFLDPSIYGGYWTRFKARYGVWGGFQNHQLLRIKEEADLRRRFFSIAYHIKASDVLDLPEAIDLERYGVLEGAAAKQYAMMENDFITWLANGHEVTAANAMVDLLRLQQITSGFLVDSETKRVEPIHSIKTQMLADLFDDLPEDEPVVVFCRFRHDLDLVHETVAASGRRSAELSGRMNQLVEWQRADLVRDAEMDYKPVTVLAAQIQAGGVGIDLTRARYCVYFSLGFSLGDYLQSRARVHRPGQTRTTFYVHLLIDKTVDVKVARALAAREDVVKRIIEGGMSQ